MRKQIVTKRLEHFGKRYLDLVWYARKDKSDPNHPERTAMRHIEREYPRLVALVNGPKGDWEHGFNSGCLATVRLVLGLLGSAEECEMAEEAFPFIDT